MELEGFKTKVTQKKWIEHVLEKYRVEYRYSTFLNYKHCLDKWFNPVWNEKFLDEIKPSDVHHVIFEDCKKTSSYTQRGLLKIVKRVFNLAIEEAILVRNPAVGIQPEQRPSNWSNIRLISNDCMGKEPPKPEQPVVEIAFFTL